MSSTIFDYEPTIVLLDGLLEDRQNILERKLFEKAVRLYLYLRVIYGNGITCGKINIKLPDNAREVWSEKWFKWADWLNKITITKIETGDIFSSEEHLDILGTISIREILFNNDLDSEKQWQKLFKLKFPNADTQVIDELLGTKQSPIYPFDRKGDKVAKNSFAELAKGERFWLKPERTGNTNKKFTGKYHTVSILPEINDGKNQKDNSLDILTQIPEYIQNEDLQDLVDKFVSNSDPKRLFFESEYAIKNALEYRDIINTLKLNWFDSTEMKLTKITYQKFIDSEIIEKVIYPIALFYTQRAPYLYFVSEQDGEIVWDAYRLDRIKQLGIIEWNDSQVSPKLLDAYQHDLLPSPEDIQDYLEADKALGYAFWKPKKWTIVRFNRSHYEKYIQATSRNELWFDLGVESLDSLPKLIKQKTKDFNRIKNSDFSIVEENIQYNQLQSVEKISNDTNNKEKYVFCLAKYYEGDSYVLQRLLAWGKQVKIMYPQKLKDRVAKEIKATWELYQE